MLDMYNCNSYGKHPDVTFSLEDELAVGKEFFTKLRDDFPTLEIIFLYGNHEHRFERWVIEKSKPLHNILRLEYELQLAQNGIEFYPYNWKYQVDKTSLFIQHSPPSYGVNGARTSLLAKADESYIFGCTHRQQHATITAGSGKIHEVYFNGWVGSIDETHQHIQVFSYRKGHTSWQQCFAMVTVMDETEFIVNQYNIRNHKCVVDGVLYEN